MQNHAYFCSLMLMVQLLAYLGFNDLLAMDFVTQMSSCGLLVCSDCIKGWFCKLAKLAG